MTPTGPPQRVEQVATQLIGGSLPYGFANDFAGTIDEIGEGVTGFSVGDRVFGSARTRAAAEFIAITVQTRVSKRTPIIDEVRRTPAGVDDITASTIPTAGLTADAAISTPFPSGKWLTRRVRSSVDALTGRSC